MPKVDALLNIIQAAMTYSNNPAINELYAMIAANRNELQQVVEDQVSRADELARDAVMWMIGGAQKPNWIAAVGI